MVNAFAHVARHKAAYLITVIIAVIMGVSAWSYGRIPDFDALKLAGATGRATSTARVTSPNGGETFVAGNGMTIQWTVDSPSLPARRRSARSVPTPTTVDIYLRTAGPNSGVQVGNTIVVPRKNAIEVARNVSGSSFNYQIRNDLRGQWKVAVVNARLQMMDESDGAFMINAPVPEPAPAPSEPTPPVPVDSQSTPDTPPADSPDTAPPVPTPPTGGPAPDLIVESIEVRPAPASHPDYYQYFATLKNIGDAGTTEQVWTYFERLSGTLVSLDGTRVNVYTDPLAAGESRTVSMGIALQCVVSAMDTEFIKAMADVRLVDGARTYPIPESNEDNNTLQIPWPSDLSRCSTPSGTLNISEYTSPPASIVVAGTTRQLVAQYGFSATGEAFNVTKLSIINDATGSFETPIDTIAVTRVQLEYPDRDGVFRTASGALVGGVATFSDLDMVARQDAVVPVRIYADIMSTDWGQTLSGQTFRLGIKENNADAEDGTFSAAGSTSSVMEYNPVFTGGSNVNSHVVRFSQPFVAKEGGDEALNNGVKNLYAVRVTADAAGPRGIEVKRIMFTLDASFRDPSDDLKTFRVRQGFDGDDLLPEEASITGESFTGTNVTDLYACSGADCWDAVDGNTANGSSLGHVVVNFATARSVSAGSSRIFVLRAEVSGASGAGESVATFIPADTGGLFTVPAASLPDMVTSFIWSDNSSTSPAHSETTSDWTNGYLVNTLPTASKVMSY